MRARVRFSRSSCCSRKTSATAETTASALILRDEGGDADGHVRLGGKAAADAQGVADFVEPLTVRLMAVRATSLISG